MTSTLTCNYNITTRTVTQSIIIILHVSVSVSNDQSLLTRVLSNMTSLSVWGISGISILLLLEERRLLTPGQVQCWELKVLWGRRVPLTQSRPVRPDLTSPDPLWGVMRSVQDTGSNRQHTSYLPKQGWKVNLLANRNVFFLCRKIWNELEHLLEILFATKELKSSDGSLDLGECAWIRKGVR